MPGYEGVCVRVLVLGYSFFQDKVNPLIVLRGTRVLVPGYEGIGAGVRGY